MQDQSQSVLVNGPDRSADSSLANTLRAQVCSSNELSFLMAAHDGLSAAIAERAEFKGLLASGPVNSLLPRIPRRQRSVMEPTRRHSRADSWFDRTACPG